MSNYFKEYNETKIMPALYAIVILGYYLPD